MRAINKRTTAAPLVAGAALLALTSAIGLTAVAPQPASAASAKGTLTDRPGRDAYHRELTVQGSFPMTRQKAQDILGQKAVITIKYWGDDPAWDDLLAVRYERANWPGRPVYLFLTDEGLGMYQRENLDSAALLNEDPEGRDEVYVEAHLSSAGRTVDRFYTFPVYGYF